MLIGEICKLTGLSRDTIRYYEKRGLIKVATSDSIFNDYKNYSEENIKRLMLIKKSKKFGFTLNEIFDILELVDNNRATCSSLKYKVTEKISNIDKQIQELEEMKKSIYSLVQSAQDTCQIRHTNKNCVTVVGR